MKRVAIAGALLAVLAGGGIAYQALITGSARSETAAPPRGGPTVPVVIAVAKREPTPVRLDAVGTVQTIASVAVKSRLDGQIAEVKVQDGQYVKAGDPVLLLDSRAAEAQVRQMEAQQARDRAQLTNAKRDVERFAPLVAKDFVSHQQYDTAATTARALEASVKADEAALENARVLLTYYTITAPMDGRIGTIALKAGSNVKANDVPILTINQTKPIWVAFSLAESDFPAVRRAMEGGAVEVDVAAPGDSEAPERGRVSFFENAIDTATGTIGLKATFDNPQERLWPGEFVNVAVMLSVEQEALVVPQAAVQVGQSSTYVFVIKPDNTAEMRPVQVSRSVAGKSVIAKGLDAGEQVVTDGQLRLTNGSRVEIRPTDRQSKPGKPS
ncbi:MAG TPA: efflux RND transporter periplasmic adaptor subunit [Stellaceae bacterium]|nr:efflux RND transporter periplasmic adaptor subunit [Stellaceae bacterium]